MLTKICEQCGAEFPKKPTCSRKDWATTRFCSQPCKAANQKGKTFPGRRRPAPKPVQLLPCRICGEPTNYHGTARCHLFGQVHCDKPECVEESRKLKNSRIAAALQDRIAESGRLSSGTWKNVATVSTHETELTPWFESMGWVAQYRFNTGVHSYKLPRQYILDFALPSARLYVEIDGKSHRTAQRQERDKLKDAMMSERGWRGLRIATKALDENPANARQLVLEFIGTYPTIMQQPH